MKTPQQLANQYQLNYIESQELYNLLNHVDAYDFKYSKELSNYITQNQLGHRYPNISGIVYMKDGNDHWDFNGGFPTKIYKIICKELNLKSQYSSAQATGFTSYNDLY